MLAHLDCFSGVSGDKFLGALLDAGLSLDTLRDRLGVLGLDGWDLSLEEVRRHGLRAARVSVSPAGEQTEARTWPRIEAIISEAGLSDRARDGALRAFRLLADAEAKVHGVPLDEVHFHEVGALDSIVDIVGVSIGLDALGIAELWASPVCVGFGTVMTRHGLLPIPAPATAELLLGVPTYGGTVEEEMTTPTGAALLRAFVTRYSAPPPGAGTAIGYGAGTRDTDVPNVLRIEIFSPASTEGTGEDVAVLESVVDHLSPEHLAAALEFVLEAGALDVWQTPVVMKKGRLASAVTVLARPEDAARLSDELARHTGTLGVRRTLTWRWAAPRRGEAVTTSLGEVKVKVGGPPASETSRPETDDVARIARETGEAVRKVAERLAHETALRSEPASRDAREPNTADAS